MRKYSIIDTIFMSFYSKKVYLDVYRNWRGLGFAYLLVVIMVFSLGELIQMQKFVTQWVINKGPAVVTQVPEMWFTDGQLHHNGDNPLLITDPQTQLPIVLIDSTLTNISAVDTSIVIVFGKDELAVDNSRQRQVVPLSNFETVTLDSEVVEHWFEVVGNWFVIFIAPFLVLQTFIVQIFVTALLALLIWVFLRYYKKIIKFSTAFRITIVASTPMLFWQAVTGLVPEPIKSMGFLTFPIGVFYIYFAANLIKTTFSGEPDSTPGPKSLEK